MFKQIFAFLILGAMLLPTMPVVADSSPEDVQACAEDAANQPDSLSFAHCITNAFYDMPAGALPDEYVNQFAFVQNPVMNPGFELPVSPVGDGSGNWAVRPGATDPVYDQNNGVLSMEGGYVKQFLGDYWGDGAFRGLAGVSLDNLGGSDIYIDVALIDADGQKFRLCWEFGVGESGFKGLEDRIEAARGNGECESLKPNDNQTAQIKNAVLHAVEVSGKAAFKVDNVILDGVAYGPQTGADADAYVEFDGYMGAMDEDGPFTSGGLYGVDNLDGMAGAEFWYHDGFTMVVVPVQFNNDNSVDFWAGALEFTPSGPVMADLTGGEFRFYDEDGLGEEQTGGDQPAPNGYPACKDESVDCGRVEGTISTLFESGRLGPQMVAYFDALGLDDVNGIVGTANVDNDAWLVAAVGDLASSNYEDKATPAPNGEHRFDVGGFFNLGKALNPLNIINDQLDLVPTPVAPAFAATGSYRTSDLDDGWAMHIEAPAGTPLPGAAWYAATCAIAQGAECEQSRDQGFSVPESGAGTYDFWVFADHVLDQATVQPEGEHHDEFFPDEGNDNKADFNDFASAFELFALESVTNFDAGGEKARDKFPSIYRCDSDCHFDGELHVPADEVLLFGEKYTGPVLAWAYIDVGDEKRPDLDSASGYFSIIKNSFEGQTITDAMEYLATPMLLTSLDDHNLGNIVLNPGLEIGPDGRTPHVTYRVEFDGQVPASGQGLHASDAANLAKGGQPQAWSAHGQIVVGVQAGVPVNEVEEISFLSKTPNGVPSGQGIRWQVFVSLDADGDGAYIKKSEDAATQDVCLVFDTIGQARDNTEWTNRVFDGSSPSATGVGTCPGARGSSPTFDDRREELAGMTIVGLSVQSTVNGGVNPYPDGHPAYVDNVAVVVPCHLDSKCQTGDGFVAAYYQDGAPLQALDPDFRGDIELELVVMERLGASYAPYDGDVQFRVLPRNDQGWYDSEGDVILNNVELTDGKATVSFNTDDLSDATDGGPNSYALYTKMMPAVPTEPSSYHYAGKAELMESCLQDAGSDACSTGAQAADVLDIRDPQFESGFIPLTPVVVFDKDSADDIFGATIRCEYGRICDHADGFIHILEPQGMDARADGLVLRPNEAGQYVIYQSAFLDDTGNDDGLEPRLLANGAYPWTSIAINSGTGYFDSGLAANNDAVTRTLVDLDNDGSKESIEWILDVEAVDAIVNPSGEATGPVAVESFVWYKPREDGVAGHSGGSADRAGYDMNKLEDCWALETDADGTNGRATQDCPFSHGRFSTVKNAFFDAGSGAAFLDSMDLMPTPVMLGDNPEPDHDGDGIPDANDPDDDNDGTLDSQDAFPHDGSETTDTDGDGIGDNADLDDDGDGYSDSVEAAEGTDPNNASSTPADLDGDGIPDSTDSDDDGDGVDDSSDAFPRDSSETADTDGDGVGDNADAFPNDATETTDSDSDGVGNNADAFPNDSSETADSDGDGVGDNADAFPNDSTETLDSDGDGVGDNSDAFPTDPAETLDSDGDGVGDNADAFPHDSTETTDTDGDGVGDNSDAFPDDASETTDSDGDTVGDNADAFPNDATETADSDGDGVGDNADAFPVDSTETSDSDGDGVGDNSDAFPNDATETTDSDGDGIGNNADACPGTTAGAAINADGCSDDQVDTDGDGINDGQDTDDDGDGYSDDVEITSGSDPKDSSSTPADNDGDGLADSVDSDDDNDGVNDEQDAFPKDGSEHTDTDGDGVGNNADTDDDGDGWTDAQEAQYGTSPTDASSKPTDTDADGTPDAADTDDDGDGWSDSDEATYGTNPVDATDYPADADSDGTPDATDTDDDNDGYADDVETAEGSDSKDASSMPVDTDGDMIPDSTDADDDGDGWSDDAEACASSDPKDASSIPTDTDGDGTPDCQDGDRDGDGMSDTWETTHFGGLNRDGHGDADSDGLADRHEFTAGTDPNNADSDDDGRTDGQEAADGTNALNADTDGDGLSDGEEANAGTDPQSADGDDDGWADVQELSYGTDPNDASDMPLDTDGDGTPDSEDADDDGDGFTDNVETQRGSDPKDATSQPAPMSVQAPKTVVDDGEILLAWDSVEEAELYAVYRTSSPYRLIAMVEDPNYVDTEVVDGKEYHYRVTAVADDEPVPEDPMVLEGFEEAPETTTVGVKDTDGDGLRDTEDSEPEVHAGAADCPAGTSDMDRDGVLDECDEDRDGDGIPNNEDADANDPAVPGAKVEEGKAVTDGETITLQWGASNAQPSRYEILADGIVIARVPGGATTATISGEYADSHLEVRPLYGAGSEKVAGSTTTLSQAPAQSDSPQQVEAASDDASGNMIIMALGGLASIVLAAIVGAVMVVVRSGGRKL